MAGVTNVSSRSIVSVPDVVIGLPVTLIPDVPVPDTLVTVPDPPPPETLKSIVPLLVIGEPVILTLPSNDEMPTEVTVPLPPPPP